MLVGHRWRCERKPVLKLLPLIKAPLLGARWGGRFAERDKHEDEGASQLAKGRGTSYLAFLWVVLTWGFLHSWCPGSHTVTGWLWKGCKYNPAIAPCPDGMGSLDWRQPYTYQQVTGLFQGSRQWTSHHLGSRTGLGFALAKHKDLCNIT